MNSGAFDPFERDRRRLRASTAPGCTSTAPSACGPPPARRAGTSPRASSTPTRGPPTPTSGSTSPTTAASRSSRDPAAHRAAMGLAAAYLVASEHRQNYDYTPEASRRARGFAIYAALRSLGRKRPARPRRPLLRPRRALRASCCRTAAPRSSTTSSSTRSWSPASPRRSPAIQTDGTCWAGGTVWHGRHALRISVSGYATTTEDIERSAAAILKALGSAPAPPAP